MKNTNLFLALAIGMTAFASTAKDELLDSTQLVNLLDGAVTITNRNTYVRDNGTCYQVDDKARAVDGPGLKPMGKTHHELAKCPEFDSGYLPNIETKNVKPIIKRGDGECFQQQLTKTNSYEYLRVNCPANW